MADIQPGFITGANARVIIGAVTMAYCTDVSYTIDVATVPIEAMGKYEVYSNEPVSYTVNGTFSVIRYTNVAKTSGISHANADGDNPKQLKFQDQLDPSQILISKTFDLEIHQAKTSNGQDASLNSFQGVFKISDCRVVRRGATLNKRGVMVDNYSFVGIIATDTDLATGSIAAPSGTFGTNVV